MNLAVSPRRIVGIYLLIVFFEKNYFLEKAATAETPRELEI